MAQSCSCNDFTRSQLLRAGIAQAGRGLPSIEPGMPLPGRHGHGPALVPAALGRARCSPSTAPRRSRRGTSKRASPQAAAAAPPNQPVLVSIFMEGGWDALSVLAPVKEARYHELRPTLGLTEGEGRAVHRGRKPDVAPAGRRPRPAARRRQGHGLPGDRLRPARREPLHQPPLLGGRRTQHPDALRLDGPLPRRRRRPRQPAAGPLARLLAGARAGDHEGARWRPSPRPRTTSFWAYGLDEPLAAPTLDTFGALGALAAPSPAFAQARAGVAGHEHHPQPGRPVRRTRRQTGVHLAGHLPDRRRRLPDPPGGARGDARRRSAADQMRLAERRRRLRHALRRGRNARAPTSARPSNRCSPSSATSKPANSTTA